MIGSMTPAGGEEPPIEKKYKDRGRSPTRRERQPATMANQTANLDESDVQRTHDLTLVRVARAGDVKAVESIIEASAPSTQHNLDTSDPHFIFPSVLNEARVWDDIVERDYENVYSWYEVRAVLYITCLVFCRMAEDTHSFSSTLTWLRLFSCKRCLSMHLPAHIDYIGYSFDRSRQEWTR